MCTPERPSRPQTPRPPSRRLRRQRLASLALDAATASYVAWYLHNDPSYMNPWGLPSSRLWALGFLVIRFGVLFYDHLVVLLVERCFRSKVLPTREAGAPPVRFVTLDARSYAYLFINSFNEYAFVMRLTNYLWRGGRGGELPWKLSELTPGNTIFALGIMFVSMDLLYAPLHHILHLPAFYPLVHKHHHRQHFPTRGYLDAGNEHPIEHMIGVMCTWFAVCSSEALLPTCGTWLRRLITGDGLTGAAEPSWARGGGVHALTVIVFFQLHAALACLNHSPYDVKFSLPFAGSTKVFGSDNGALGWLEETMPLGKWARRLVTGQWFRYSVGHHEMHHRKFNFNYGQYCMLYDLCMGTFIQYEGPMTAAQIEAKKARKPKEG